MHFFMDRKFIRSFDRAKEHLEYFFDLPLTMSDKMFLRRYVAQYIESNKKADIFSTSRPEAQAALHFLIAHYPQIDFELAIDSIQGGARCERLSRYLFDMRNSP